MASEMTREYRINLVRAIKSLDTLNDQIVQYIFAQHDVDVELESALSPGEQETLRSSMVLIRSLLNQAQAKFRKMVEDNKQLAARIDASIQAANQEVTSLRAELADTNKRLSEISANVMTEDKATQIDCEMLWSRDKADGENELVKLREENARLEVSLRTLTRDLEEAQRSKVKVSSLGQTPSYGELKLELIQTRQELNRAKDALQAMKSDRKRLKGEKLDLLNQMKQLYGTLEEKEADLQDFIRNYEQRVKESDDSIKQLASEKEESEREKWEIIKKAREAAERAVLLRAQLDSSEQRIRQLETQLRGRDTDPSTPTTGLGSSDTLVGEEEGVPPTSTPSTPTAAEQPPQCLPTPSSTPSSTSAPSSSFATAPSASSTPLDSVSRNSASRESTPSTASMDRTDPMTPLLRWFNSEMQEADSRNKMKKKRSFGSLPKLFSRARSRRSIAVPSAESVDESGGGGGVGGGKLALLSPDNYQEKLASVQAARDTPMSQWKASQVLAWLETALAMPMYGRQCALNIKSGKVLLELSDSDLSSALGMTNPLHRRKLRLAIEEQRHPAHIRYPKAGYMDHTWVALCWLPELGLPQYSSVFERHLVDGRLLDSLTKKDLEKHLEVHRRFHQASILHSIHLLRRLNFDKEVLAERRSQCEESDTDPLVWSNSRVIQWIRSIDLEEYAGKLLESGVNGAVMVLEPSFTADTLATALAIPPANSYVRRHLASELSALIKPARQALDTPNNNSKGSSSSSLSRSYRSLSTSDETPKRLSFRGSLGRAFGRKIRDDLRMAFDNDSSPRRKISAPIPIQHNRSLDSIVEPHHESTPV